MRWTPFLIVAAATGLLVALLAFGFGTNPREVPSVLEGQVAPACSLDGLDGEQITLAGLRGKPVVVNFWSTWCVPCKTEHGFLQRAARDWRGRVEFIGVVYQDEESKTRAYLAQRGSEYRHFMDPDSKCAIDYGVAGVPETFFIDSNGIIRHKQTGPVTPGTLTAALNAVLAGAQP
jgi:cytochrome c biogenesis protein CcmG/thiol:disulfide interchange protein DsbE